MRITRKSGRWCWEKKTKRWYRTRLRSRRTRRGGEEDEGEKNEEDQEDEGKEDEDKGEEEDKGKNTAAQE